MARKKIGKVTHYYDHVEVGVVKLAGGLLVGDKIEFLGSNDFSQEVVSMQVDHKPIKKAGKGQEIGLKVDQPVKEGDEVFKVS